MKLPDIPPNFKILQKTEKAPRKLGALSVCEKKYVNILSRKLVI